MRLAALDAHRVWAPSYDATPNPLLDLELRILSAALAPWRRRRVVDVACGTGRWMAHALACGGRVIGVDLCREMLQCAAAKPELTGRLALARADTLPLASRAFDLAICSFALGFFPAPAVLIREMARLVAPSGRIVLSDVHPEAFRAGWKRTFRAGGAVYEIDHSPYSESALLAAAADAGLLLDRTFSLTFGEPERETFRRIGKEHLYNAAAGLPAVWAAIWSKRA